ncbi:hypothetical protein DPMN_008847 [Dreissena polymorpha]|uniref:Uncharacterized protein n=1 Tax=Dreissena polymorpha TaxID=45954 RepID=A0A9D4N195_DREPO|nr:hypothetical protein DPMN_008847 [Dreissena polymorpha]
MPIGGVDRCEAVGNSGDRPAAARCSAYGLHHGYVSVNVAVKVLQLILRNPEFTISYVFYVT